VSQQVIGDWNLRNFPPPIQTRKVIIQRAGGLYRARYAGMSNNCFGINPKDAASKLKFFEGTPCSTKSMMREKFKEGDNE
jgi:hypothetical protein